jgi:hypothetical protein
MGQKKVEPEGRKRGGKRARGRKRAGRWMPIGQRKVQPEGRKTVGGGGWVGRMRMGQSKVWERISRGLVMAWTRLRRYQKWTGMGVTRTGWRRRRWWE